MRPYVACLVALCTLISAGFVSAPDSGVAEKRIALVIGNAGYQTGALPTAANDAGLIAQTLQAAGFDVVGARDLDQDSLRRAMREFLDKASRSGPDTVAFIYLSGYGLQLAGENYFVPVDAKIGRDADIAAQALRVSDYVWPLGSLGLKASVVVLDLARRTPFGVSGEPIAGGLALVEPSPGMLMAFNAAPGTIASEQSGSYGAYAQSLAEMMRAGVLSLDQVFERVRLRVSDVTKGAQIPWNASRVKAPFVFFERSPDAPPVAENGESSERRARPLAELGANDAYSAALERDTLQSYEEFLGAYPDSPVGPRVRAIIAARREAITWRETCVTDTPQGYWSYLQRYPHGPHQADARRRLALRAMASEPPASFAPIDYDVPPPASGEDIYVERPVLAFDDPELGFAPPPPAPIYFLPPPPPEFILLDAPFAPIEPYVLPVPVFVPIPAWCHRPSYVAAPPDNVIFNNIHNRVVIDQARHVATIRDQHGAIVSPPQGPGRDGPGHDGPGGVSGHGGSGRGGSGDGGSGSGARTHLALAPALPRSVMNRVPSAASPLSALAHGGPRGQALPGFNGHPLPPVPGGSPRAPGSRAPATLSAPVNAAPVPGAGRPVPSRPITPNPSARPAYPQPPYLAARPPTQTPRMPFAAPSNNPRILPPAATTHERALPPPAMVRPTPPAQALRSPPAAGPRGFNASPPAQMVRPMVRPLTPPLAPPVAAIRPPSPPSPAYRPAPPPAAAIRQPSPAPVYRPAPPPMVRAAPAAPPPMRAAPPAMVRAAPAAPAPRVAPPVARAPAAPGRRG